MPRAVGIRAGTCAQTGPLHVSPAWQSAGVAHAPPLATVPITVQVTQLSMPMRQAKPSGQLSGNGVHQKSSQTPTGMGAAIG